MVIRTSTDDERASPSVKTHRNCSENSLNDLRRIISAVVTHAEHNRNIARMRMGAVIRQAFFVRLCIRRAKKQCTMIVRVAVIAIVDATVHGIKSILGISPKCGMR
jgi:hypothetical protein